MTKSLLSIAVFLFPGAAVAQEERDNQIQAVAQKLVKEGASAKLAELAQTAHGLQAIKEKIDYLVACRTGRFERDAQGYFEDYLFKTQEDGSLVVRPERSDLLDRMKKAVARAPKVLEAFGRRLDALATRIGEAGELDKRLKAGLKDPEIRVALFHHYAAEVRESDNEELLYQALAKAFERKPDGKLRLGGAFRQEVMDRIRATYEQLDAVKEYEAAYLKAIGKLNDEGTRRLASAENAVIFVLGRIVRQTQEGVEDRIGDLVEGDADNNVQKGVTLNEQMVLEPLRAFTKLADDLKPILERMGKEIASDGVAEIEAFDFLRNDRARYLLTERILALREDQGAKADYVFKQIKEDWFIAAGDKLVVKAGRFVDERALAQVDSPDVVQNELQNLVNELNGARAGLDQIAERLSDPSLIGLFGKRDATFAINDQMQEVIQTLSDAVRKEGLQILVKLYLAPTGDRYGVRPERAKRIDEMAKRAEEIRKEMEKAGQDP